MESKVRRFGFGVHFLAEGRWANSKVAIVIAGLIHAAGTMLGTLQERPQSKFTVALQVSALVPLLQIRKLKLREVW